MEQNKKLKMLNAFSAISIIAFLASIGVWVLMGFNIIEFSGFMVVVAGILTTLSLPVTLCLPWIKKIAQNTYKVASIVFIALSGLAFLLLSADIICLYVIINKIAASKTLVVSDFAGLLNFLKYSLLIVVQIVISTIIANYVLRFKKRAIIFQGLSYICLLYIDFAISVVALSISINEKGVSFSNTAGLFTSVPFWLGLTVAVAGWGWLYRTLKRVDKFFGTSTTKEIFKDEKPVQETNSVVAQPESAEAVEVSQPQAEQPITEVEPVVSEAVVENLGNVNAVEQTEPAVQAENTAENAETNQE